MTEINTTASFSGDSNHGFQLVSNLGHLHVDFHGQSHKHEIGFSDEERRCFETIRTSNYLARKDLNPERLPGTCNWFFNHTKYQDWIAQTSASRLLWVSADPGCGKSVLAKALVDQYNHGSVCYYFFKDDTMVTRSAAHALCAILHQICGFRPALIKYVLPVYKRNGGKLVDLFEDLWSAFVDVINDEGFGGVICILDAIDECSDHDFKKLLQGLAAIATSSTSIKILITSRPYTSIETALFHKTGLDRNEIRLSGEAEAEQSIIEKEIGLYITSRVQEFRELRESNDIFDNAPEKLQVHLDGIKNRTYLWVSAVFNELKSDVYASEYILMETINALPDNVHQAYEKILEKSSKKHILIQVLHVMLAAFRPLSVMEMNMALSIQYRPSGGPRYSGLHPASSFCKWLRDLCGFFVNIINDKLYFAHQTAREFLVGEGACQATVGWRGSFQTDDSHTRIARVCIDYLLLMYRGSVDATFKDYATIYWPTHCQNLAMDQSLAEKVNGFLFPTDKANSPTAKWTMDIKRLVDSNRRFDFIWSWNLDRGLVSSIRPPSTPLYLACRLGWPSVIHFLTSSSNFDWNQMIGIGRAIGLVIAARNGHIEVVKLLLMAGADINLQDGDEKTALGVSVESYHLEIVELLLAAGADIDPNTQRLRALHVAAGPKHLELVKILLNAGTDVSKKMFGSTALHIAASNGYLEIVKRLLAAEAAFNLQDHDRDTALHLGATKGYLEIVKLLLNTGADINFPNQHGETALHLAVENDQLKIMDLLLKAGADINAKSKRGTALQLATKEGYCLEKVKLLLASGADCNVQDDYGDTALRFAACRGHFEIVKLLLAAGADSNLQGANGYTALHRGATKGRLEIVKLLLAAGVNADLQDVLGDTALHLAALQGHLDIVRLLLSAGADTNFQNQRGETALQFAVENDHLKVMELLLKAGANVNAKNQKGTVLHYATKNINLEIVKLLLAAGANADLQDFVGNTALHHAALQGHLDIVKLLLNTGADINFPNRCGLTALHFAVQYNEFEMVKLLLKAGANVNVESQRGTALYNAREQGLVKIVQILLAAEASD